MRYGKFNTRLQVVELKGKKKKLLAPLTYTLRSGITKITVPEGFITDGASIDPLRYMGLLLLFSLLIGYGERAHTVHDYLYATQPERYTRKDVEKLYYEMLRADGVARWRASIYYAGVYAFGWYRWNQIKKQNKK